ncbi:MAG: exodeoxyribonuclease VII large subunit [Bacilli bacterium]|nr:exodeoxyribonuclease VII large subunit [Bacilli bacterium]
MDNNYQTIGEFTRYLKLMFDTSTKMRNVYLKGEISNLKIHTTGHIYFSLKDETSKINAMMFSSSAKNLKFVPQEGMKVLVHGRVSIYEATGNYQIYVDNMEEDGLGNLYIEFEKLKKKLQEEGLFAEEHKKPIPKYPKKIGVVTASTGAAIRDIISTIKRRYPIVTIYLYSSLVQGEGAKDDIVRNIKRANEDDLDVLIVGRGGGSIEDLWPFNEEVVAHAIYESRIPIISAVGHEVDFTIADFVADRRAETPTGAAEIAVPNIGDVIGLINNYKIRLNGSMKKLIDLKRVKLDSLKDSYILKNPIIMYENKEQKLMMMMDKIGSLMKHNVEAKRLYFNNLKNNHIFINPDELYKDKVILLGHILDKLELINPLGVLKRGYTLTYKEDKIISSVNDVSKNDILKIKLVDGNVNTKVIDKE